MIRSVIQRLRMSSFQSKVIEGAGKKTDQLLQVLDQTEDMRPAEIYRLLVGLPDEAIVLLVAKGLVMRKGRGVHRLTRRLSRLLKHDRQMTTILRGEDLIRLGLKPGPQFKSILDRLLDARLNGRVKTELDERAFVHRVTQKSR